MTIAFGSFVLDTERHQLLKAGREVHLSRKAYDLLTLLVQARPKVMSKGELHERLWPGTFVSDATLASLVAEVREALDDPARQHRFIRTVHGVGYGFDGEATETAATTTLPRAVNSLWLNWGDQRVDLREGETVLGRDPHATICIESLSVSRRHARIIVSDGEATVEDLGSRNGTFVGPTQVTSPTVLKDGDTLRVGSIALTFRNMLNPSSTESVR